MTGLKTRPRGLQWLVCAAAAVAALEPAAAAPQYTLTDLGKMAVDGSPQAVNAAGQVAGWNQNAQLPPGVLGGVVPLVDPAALPIGGYVWSNGTAAGLDSVPSSLTRAYAISDDGVVAGVWNVGTSTKGAAVWTDTNGDGVADSAGFEALPRLPGGTDAAAYGINNHNQVAGFSNQTVGGQLWSPHAFLYTDADGFGTGAPGTIIDLGTLGAAALATSVASDVNNAGVVVGQADTGTSFHAFAWKDANGNGQSNLGEMIDLGAPAGYDMSVANAVNDGGLAVGMAFSLAAGGFAPAVWADSDGDGVPDAGGEALGTLGGPGGEALGVNSGGLIVGWSFTSDLERHAFLYDPETGQTLDLNDLFSGPLGWTLTSAAAINDAGLIVGYGELEGGSPHAFLLTPTGTDLIPEPLTCVLFSACCWTAALYLRKRKPRQSP